MNKYLPLYQYLSKLEANHVKLSFKDIEEIISDELPMSAKNTGLGGRMEGIFKQTHGWKLIGLYRHNIFLKH